MPIKFIGSKLYFRILVVTFNNVLTAHNNAQGVGFLREKTWNFCRQIRSIIGRTCCQKIPFSLVIDNFWQLFTCKRLFCKVHLPKDLKLCYVYNLIPWEYVLSIWNVKNVSQGTSPVNFFSRFPWRSCK